MRLNDEQIKRIERDLYELSELPPVEQDYIFDTMKKQKRR